VDPASEFGSRWSILVHRAPPAREPSSGPIGVPMPLSVATIKAECPRCGVVRLRVSDLTVRVCADRDDEGAYRFRCPACSAAVLHAATSSICSLLVSVGVDEEIWRLPAELEESHTGAAFTPDDVLDFHLLLGRDDWADALVAPEAPGR
jgi:ribosomal protein S27AE